MTKRLVRVLALACVALLALSSAALGDIYRVKATADDRWNPDFRHILQGDSVRWKNPARHDEVHNVKACPACGGREWSFFETLSPGEGVRKRFRRSGTYAYRCSVHSAVIDGDCNGMCGTIHVQ